MWRDHCKAVSRNDLLKAGPKYVYGVQRFEDEFIRSVCPGLDLLVALNAWYFGVFRTLVLEVNGFSDVNCRNWRDARIKFSLVALLETS